MQVAGAFSYIITYKTEYEVWLNFLTYLHNLRVWTRSVWLLWYNEIYCRLYCVYVTCRYVNL